MHGSLPETGPGTFPHTVLNKLHLSRYYHSQNFFFFTNDYPLCVPLCLDTWQQGHGWRGLSLVLTSTPTAAHSDPAKHVVGGEWASHCTNWVLAAPHPLFKFLLECTGFRHQNVWDLGATALLSPGMWGLILCCVCTPQTTAEMIHRTSDTEPKETSPKPSMGLSFEISHHRIFTDD